MKESFDLCNEFGFDFHEDKLGQGQDYIVVQWNEFAVKFAQRFNSHLKCAARYRKVEDLDFLDYVAVSKNKKVCIQPKAEPAEVSEEFANDIRENIQSRTGFEELDIHAENIGLFRGRYIAIDC
jgi:hypothetical protein